MSNSKTLTFWSDPGHGWLVVPVRELASLGISGAISPYSYVSYDGETAYLEEDCDAGVYLNSLRAAGVDFVFDEKYSENIFIRELPSYSAPKEVA